MNREHAVSRSVKVDGCKLPNGVLFYTMLGMVQHPASWNPQEWKKVRKRLELLSVPQLKELVTALGIVFEGGTDSLQERPALSIKDQLILVLDETDPEELLRKLDALGV